MVTKKAISDYKKALGQPEGWPITRALLRCGR